MTDAPSLKPLYKRMIFLGIFMSGASLFWGALPFAGGVLAGTVLATANLWLIQRSVNGLLARQKTSIKGTYILRMTGVLVILFLLIKFAGLDPLGVLVGFSVLVIVLLTGGAVLTQDLTTEDGADGAELESNDGTGNRDGRSDMVKSDPRG